MAKNVEIVLTAIVVSLCLMLVVGCESDAQTGTLLGSAAGAGIGALAGGDTKSTLIGAGIGGAVGYGLGNEGDKKKTRAEIDSLRQQQNTVTVWVTNSNGSKSPVVLRKSGPTYIGPQGETYTSMPTEEQLRQLYAR
jgi:hypothetical protein